MISALVRVICTSAPCIPACHLFYVCVATATVLVTGLRLCGVRGEGGSGAGAALLGRRTGEKLRERDGDTGPDARIGVGGGGGADKTAAPVRIERTRLSRSVLVELLAVFVVRGFDRTEHSVRQHGTLVPVASEHSSVHRPFLGRALPCRSDLSLFGPRVWHTGVAMYLGQFVDTASRIISRYGEKARAFNCGSSGGTMNAAQLRGSTVVPCAQRGVRESHTQLSRVRNGCLHARRQKNAVLMGLNRIPSSFLYSPTVRARGLFVTHARTAVSVGDLDGPVLRVCSWTEIGSRWPSCW